MTSRYLSVSNQSTEGYFCQGKGPRPKYAPLYSIAIVIDTRYCQNAIEIAQNTKLLLCESIYQEEHHDLAYKHFHLTTREAATIAKQAGVRMLV